MRCVHCNYEILGRRHEILCPYNKINARKIILYLRDYVLENSKFNKNFSPFPKPRELDIFLRKNKIARVRTISKRYLDDLRLNDWLIEFLDYCIIYGIVDEGDFPYFLQYIYDAWVFKPIEQYKILYEKSVEYEDGEFLIEGKKQSETIARLRRTSLPFKDNQRPVKEYIQ